ncbi:DUF6483 family protein [Clostridium kluyveri]|uniref:Uncharacterized protein n=1 Tax=Clostridium kluyveri TaxID=1534 RepID=A0A1L5F475_CLOKL|nr:DUF6483 family protein [Clostridium kluyveri]APM37815.1 hypothetical protein BS101_03210 [Clostridium kluyveri]UZQ52187.1 DUF6483 family protein [Clostridium kluyveri]
MYEEDYIKRLITSIGQMLVAISAGRDAVKSNIKLDNNNVTISEDGLLEIMIRKDMHEGKLNEAENRIIEEVKSHKSKRCYEIALFFYNEINEWDENKLIKCNFSKQRIIEGLKFVEKTYKQN